MVDLVDYLGETAIIVGGFVYLISGFNTGKGGSAGPPDISFRFYFRCFYLQLLLASVNIDISRIFAYLSVLI